MRRQRTFEAPGQLETDRSIRAWTTRRLMDERQMLQRSGRLTRHTRKNPMTDSFDKTGEAAAFQKMWLESFSKTMQAAFKFTPDSAPPDVVRQIRAGIFQTLAESWDEYMRSPQFLDGMRQWMDNAISFRKISNEFMGRVRNDLQMPSRTDIDTVVLAVRHMEKRLLDRLDEISTQLARNNSAGAHSPGSKATKTKRTAARKGRFVKVKPR